MLTDIQWAYVHDANKMAFIMTRIKGQDGMQEGSEPKELSWKSSLLCAIEQSSSDRTMWKCRAWPNYKAKNGEKLDPQDSL